MYAKVIEDGYITTIGTDIIGEEISESEYNAIMSVILNSPKPSEGKGYRLTEDLTWEEYDLPTPSEDEDISAEEALAIITGESV